MRDDLIEDSGGEMYGRINERSELQRFRDCHSEEELDEFVDEYEALWREFFLDEMSKDVPRHPWKVFKEARSHYANVRNDGDWPSMEKRHALRVVKDEFVERWERYKENFNKD